MSQKLNENSFDLRALWIAALFSFKETDFEFVKAERLILEETENIFRQLDMKCQFGTKIEEVTKYDISF